MSAHRSGGWARSRYFRGRSAAALYSLIQTARLNNVDPQAWLAAVLARIADHPASRLDELLPWNWMTRQAALAA